MARFLSVTYVLTLAVWFGGLCTLVLTIPSLFTQLERDTAGDAAALVFKSFDNAKMWLVPLIWISLAGSMAFRRPARNRVVLAVLALSMATVSFLIVRSVLVPKMDDHRALVHAGRTDSDPQRQIENRLAFDRMHRLSEGLMGANLLLTGFLLLEAVWPLRPGDGALTEPGDLSDSNK